MNWQAILGVIWAALNSPMGITAVAGVVLYLLNRLYAAKPAWAQYEGAIISAVRFAEKEIPDDAPNKGLRRLDEALRYVLRVFHEANKREPTKTEAMALREGVQIVHNELDAEGVLSK